jgi:hypothetical protein
MIDPEQSIAFTILQQIRETILQESKYFVEFIGKELTPAYNGVLSLSVSNPTTGVYLVAAIKKDRIILVAIPSVPYLNNLHKATLNPGLYDLNPVLTKTIRDIDNKRQIISLHDQDFINITVRTIIQMCEQ